MSAAAMDARRPGPGAPLDESGDALCGGTPLGSEGLKCGERPECIAALSYAQANGYDLGHDHGRAAERGLMAEERAQRRAGDIVARMADYPPVDPPGGRQRAAERARRWSA